ncbi:MAG: hypothetical protein JNK46_01505 [Methylobacteriaceae bacterium]|nr:hypothetical protein [Methylobacteriaceae bacterium]
MRRRIFGALALALTAASAGAAQAESFAARATIAAMENACRAAGGQPQSPPGLTRATRIGGAAAVVVDFQPFLCKGAASPACGPFGCQVRLFVGAATTPAFEGQVRAWRVRGATFQVTRVGAYCANAAGGACSESYEIAGGALRLAARGSDSFSRDAYRAAAPSAERAAPRRSRPVGTRGVRGRIAPDTAYEPPPAPVAEPPAAPSQSSEQRRRTLRSAPYVP